MTLILETGAGVKEANSYVLPDFVTTYLTDRGREAEGLWSTAAAAQQEAACIAATDYIDKRWGAQFKSTRAVLFNGENALAQLNYTGNPADADTFTLGDQAYIYVTVLADLGNNEILIGVDTDETVQNTIDAINGNIDNLNFSRFLGENRNATAILVEGFTDKMRLVARQVGVTGNTITLTATSTSITVNSTFVNGVDGGSQPLEFPRLALFDQDGRAVPGIPLKLKQSASEYAVRALTAALYQDPTIDPSARTVNRNKQKVGPIETDVTFEEGGALSQVIRPYPAADSLLSDYVLPTGRAFR